MNCGRESCVCPVIKERISMQSSSLKMGSSISICLASGPKKQGAITYVWIVAGLEWVLGREV